MKMDILKWYRGKALELVRDEAIPMLSRSEAQDYWEPKASRRVRSLLRKTSKVAVANAVRGAPSIDVSGRYGLGWHYEIEFGCVETAARMRKDVVNLARVHHDDTLRWISDFAPIAELMHHLDEQRPRPEYVFAKVSPGVYENVGKTLGLEFSSVRQPEIQWEKETIELPGGQKVMQWVGHIIWPEGTRHNLSKFSYGSKAGNDQCQACGHAIKNQHNWVPLLLDGFVQVNGERAPVSLWTGKDCAETLFGAKIAEMRHGRFERK